MSNASCPRTCHDGWSEVRASDQVIRYRRCGTGRPVLVLLPDDRASGQPNPRLVEALSTRFRLLVPEMPAAPADAATRLALFLDGLGVGNVAVLAFGDLCIPGLELALLGGDLVTRLALVTEGRTTMPELDGALVTAPGQSPLPLVLLRDHGAVLDDVELLVRFLDGAAPDRLLAPSRPAS